MFESAHLSYLLSCTDLKEPAWQGGHIRKWADYLFEKAEAMPSGTSTGKLKEGKISRSEVYAYVADSNNSLANCVITILAWGGMNRKHGVSAMDSWQGWCHIAEAVRAGKLSRKEAYKQFMAARKSGVMDGMGPAYFTKLIFFLAPAHDGYIMDQWTARSMNLLCCEPVVHLQQWKRSGAKFVSCNVTDNNTASTYETFCLRLERLSAEIGCDDPKKTEELIFSTGRGKGRWRNYVRKHG